MTQYTCYFDFITKLFMVPIIMVSDNIYLPKHLLNSFLNNGVLRQQNIIMQANWVPTLFFVKPVYN